MTRCNAAFIPTRKVSYGEFSCSDYGGYISCDPTHAEDSRWGSTVRVSCGWFGEVHNSVSGAEIITS